MSALKKHIMTKINLSTLSVVKGKYRTLGELASDVVNNAGMADKELAGKCNLSAGTVKRLRVYKKPYNPNTSTVEKVLLAFNISLKAL